MIKEAESRLSGSAAGSHQAASAQEARVLIFSQRNLAMVQPFRCAHFEFEDVIAEVDAADILAPRLNPGTRRYRAARQLAYHSPVALNPGIREVDIRKGYDLFLAICGDPIDLLWINSLGPWRENCKKAVCLIDELWITLMRSNRQYLEMLRKFDHVVLYYSQSVEPLNERIGPRAFYLPPAVDTIRFCPYPEAPERVVDVYSIGRRSAASHRELMKMAETESFHYIYDTTSADRVLDPAEHRKLYANILKRSRYFMVNPALIDRPDIRGSQIEIGYRYFDGIAAGAILVGERPVNGVFKSLFDWPDSLMDLPYSSPEIGAVMRRLDERPDEQEHLRQQNVRQALQRHDWAHRWEAILERAGLDPLPGLAARKARLGRLGEMADAGGYQGAAVRQGKPAAGSQARTSVLDR